MKRKFIAIVAAAVLSATVLGGCGGKDESKESTDIPSTEQTNVWSTYNTRKVKGRRIKTTNTKSLTRLLRSICIRANTKALRL